MVDYKATNNDELLSNRQLRRYLTIKEAAALLKVCQKTIRRWDAAGKITCYRTPGSHRRIPMSEIIRLQGGQDIPPIQCTKHPQDDASPLEQKDPPILNNEPYVMPESALHPEQKAPILPEQKHLLRHDMNALKTQLKLLRYLLLNSFNSDANHLVLMDLINIMREITHSNSALEALQQDIIELWSKATLHLQKLEQYQAEQQQQSLPMPQHSPPVLDMVPKRREQSASFLAARENASSVFLHLIKATIDTRLDSEERTRAHEIVNNILSPYRQLTKNLIDYPEGTLEHDVTKLLLMSHPSDYGILKNRWSVRTLASVCKQLGTKSCSKSQIGRFYKRIQWHRLIREGLISPDPKFGEKMKAIGNAIASLKEEDCLLYSDEFKFTSSKVAQHLNLDHAPAGLQHGLVKTFNTHYSPVCSIQITGVYNPKNGHLETTEISDLTFESVGQGIVQLCKRFLSKIKGKIVLILDNATNHSPGLLKPYLKAQLGERIDLYYLPTYCPNNNPIEGIWNILLNSIVRHCSTQQELRIAFFEALQAFKQMNHERVSKEQELCCPICHTHLSFSDHQHLSGAEIVDKHLCFNISGLTPYTIDVLTNSLEIF